MRRCGLKCCGLPARCLSQLSGLVILGAALLEMALLNASEPGAGIVIYTTLDNGRDETAIAVPFRSAEQFALVTNVTTHDGRSIRVTTNMLKVIVRPRDLSQATVVDDVGLNQLTAEKQSLRSLQMKYPQTGGVLSPLVEEIDRAVQLIESGNVLIDGRAVAKSEYEKQVAASKARTVDITLNGRAYRKARLSSVGEGKVNLTHAEGVASIPLERLSDMDISQLNGTSTSVLIEKVAAATPPPSVDTSFVQPTKETPIRAAASAPLEEPTPATLSDPPLSLPGEQEVSPTGYPVAPRQAEAITLPTPSTRSSPTMAPVVNVAPLAAVESPPAVTSDLLSTRVPRAPRYLGLAGVLVLAATGGAVLLANRRRTLLKASCPRCGQFSRDARDYPDERVTCQVCGHQFAATNRSPGERTGRASSPGPLVYTGVGMGSVLLLVSVFLQLEHTTTTAAERSRYTLSHYPADLYPLREAAEAGDVDAQYTLAQLHDHGMDALPSDPREAALWYLTAAEGGHPASKGAIGTLYDWGRGIEPDPVEAERWLKEAAEEGVVEAQRILGLLYLGKGSLLYQPEAAIRWLTEAARHGDGEAMLHLSAAYRKGVEVSPDSEASERWLQKSAETGFEPAVLALGRRDRMLREQADAMWRQVEDSMPPYRGSSPYSANPYTTYIPPVFEEGRRRMEALRQSEKGVRCHPLSLCGHTSDHLSRGIHWRADQRLLRSGTHRRTSAACHSANQKLESGASPHCCRPRCKDPDPVTGWQHFLR